MSLYICEKCGAIENTAVGGYWKNRSNDEPKMCSECNFGKWHGIFKKKHYTQYAKEELLEMESKGLILNAKDYLKQSANMEELE